MINTLYSIVIQLSNIRNKDFFSLLPLLEKKKIISAYYKSVVKPRYLAMIMMIIIMIIMIVIIMIIIITLPRHKNLRGGQMFLFVPLPHHNYITDYSQRIYYTHK